MTLAQLDISTPRIGLGRIEISRQSISMVSTSPSKQALRDEIARQTAQFCAGAAITVAPTASPRPYLETPRKQEPDILARMERRAKERLKEMRNCDLYMQPEVMVMYGCHKSPAGYREFNRMIDAGEIPQPDEMRSLGNNKFTRRWLRERIDQDLKIKQLLGICCDE